MKKKKENSFVYTAYLLRLETKTLESSKWGKLEGMAGCAIAEEVGPRTLAVTRIG